jgi:hypothetical protein
MSSLMTTSGNSAANAVTKSASPLSATAATICRVAAVTLSVMELMIFGVNPRATSMRSRVCWGASWLSIISSVPSAMSMRSAPPRADENVATSRSIAMTSRYFVHTQKPDCSSSVGGCHQTGASLRSQVKNSWGGPAAKVAGSLRSTGMTGATLMGPPSR